MFSFLDYFFDMESKKNKNHQTDWEMTKKKISKDTDRQFQEKNGKDTDEKKCETSDIENEFIHLSMSDKKQLWNHDKLDQKTEETHLKLWRKYWPCEQSISDFNVIPKFKIEQDGKTHIVQIYLRKKWLFNEGWKHMYSSRVLPWNFIKYMEYLSTQYSKLGILNFNASNYYYNQLAEQDSGNEDIPTIKLKCKINKHEENVNDVKRKEKKMTRYKNCCLWW